MLDYNIFPLKEVDRTGVVWIYKDLTDFNDRAVNEGDTVELSFVTSIVNGYVDDTSVYMPISMREYNRIFEIASSITGEVTEADLIYTTSFRVTHLPTIALLMDRLEELSYINDIPTQPIRIDGMYGVELKTSCPMETLIRHMVAIPNSREMLETLRCCELKDNSLQDNDRGLPDGWIAANLNGINIYQELPSKDSDITYFSYDLPNMLEGNPDGLGKHIIIVKDVYLTNDNIKDCRLLNSQAVSFIYHMQPYVMVLNSDIVSKLGPAFSKSAASMILDNAWFYIESAFKWLGLDLSLVTIRIHTGNIMSPYKPKSTRGNEMKPVSKELIDIMINGAMEENNPPYPIKVSDSYGTEYVFASLSELSESTGDDEATLMEFVEGPDIFIGGFLYQAITRGEYYEIKAKEDGGLKTPQQRWEQCKEGELITGPKITRDKNSLVHPIQPLYMDEVSKGVRFKNNAIVDSLVKSKTHYHDLLADTQYSHDDKMQLMQLIGCHLDHLDQQPGVRENDEVLLAAQTMFATGLSEMEARNIVLRDSLKRVKRHMLALANDALDVDNEYDLGVSGD